MKKRTNYKRLGELLVERSVITAEQLELALADQKKNSGLLGEILISWGYTTEESIVGALIDQYKFAYIQTSTYQSSEEVIRLIPKEMATRYSLVGLDKFGERITVAMSDPLNEEAIIKLEEETGCAVDPLITTYTEIMRTIELHYEVRRPGSI
ncbi:MAG: type IV pilus assembly protein PilB [Candidatus Omnitrophota bacterium]|jgi:type IV pilus assembly protein PilB